MSARRPRAPAAIHRAVRSARTRAEAALRTKAFGALALAASDLAYLVSYLEGNAPFIDAYSELGEARAFLQGKEFRSGFASALEASVGGDSERALPLACQPTNLRVAGLGRAERKAFASLDAAAEALDRDLVALVTRIGASIPPAGVRVAIFGLSGRIEPAETFCKFGAALNRVKARRAPELVAALDELRTARFERARAEGFASPAQSTIAGGTLGIEDIARFIDAACEAAEATARALPFEVDAPPDAPLDLALARHLQSCQREASALRLPVTACGELACEVAARAFDLAFERQTGGGYQWTVHEGQRRLGRIIFDRSGSAAAASLPCAADSDEDAPGPTGRALCRLAGLNPDVMHLEAARALFHEFGHALVHVLTASGEIGLAAPDATSIERLELASTWFEQFIFHPGLDDRLNLNGAGRDTLAAARRIKTLEAMVSSFQSAAVAALDFALHRDPGLPVETALSELAARSPALAALTPSDLVAGFVHPFSRAHPGGAFVYPLAHSFAAERFATLLDADLGAMHVGSLGLEAAVRTNAALSLPDAAATSRLFGRLLVSVAQSLRCKEVGA